MTEVEGEMILNDRIMKIQSVITKYDPEKFCITFSGGKDSTVLHYLVDEAIPGNDIPRLFVNTGIEMRAIVDFVKGLAQDDPRITIISPGISVRKMLDEEGYPFKSKYHSDNVARRWKHGFTKSVSDYYNRRYSYNSRNCPIGLRYQFEQPMPFKISDKCCDRLKKDPIIRYEQETGRIHSIIGIRAEEGGRRNSAKCMAFKGAKLHFQPLAVITEDWIDWYIQKRGIQLCKLYYPPYNFTRTGCKGCPFAKDLQHNLDVLEEFFPNERKQCEIIWKPVYDEYRRLGYRLKS